MQLVVVMAVRKAVSAATTTFTAISMKRFFIIVNFQLSIVHALDLVDAHVLDLGDAPRLDVWGERTEAVPLHGLSALQELHHHGGQLLDDALDDVA